MAVDVHQHLWPEELVDRLRARSRAPYLRGWTLHTEGEPAYDVVSADHDPEARVATDLAAGVSTACVSLSAPLGIEALPRPEASGLIAAWHRGALALPDHFRVWASVPDDRPSVGELTALLANERVVGLQLPATLLGSPAGWERVAGLLAAVERADKVVFVHPGPVRSDALRGPVPGWWAPVVPYVGQLHAAWWAWQAVGGRTLFPDLRLLFAAAAGLAPVHHERHVLRGGEEDRVDPQVFVDSAGYGPRALDAVVRTLGIDALVLGSDRPYGEPATELFGEAATRAVRDTNPGRLLEARPRTEGVDAWAFAS